MRIIPRAFDIDCHETVSTPLDPQVHGIFEASIGVANPITLIRGQARNGKSIAVMRELEHRKMSGDNLCLYLPLVVRDKSEVICKLIMRLTGWRYSKRAPHEAVLDKLAYCLVDLAASGHRYRIFISLDNAHGITGDDVRVLCALVDKVRGLGWELYICLVMHSGAKAEVLLHKTLKGSTFEIRGLQSSMDVKRCLDSIAVEREHFSEQVDILKHFGPFYRSLGSAKDFHALLWQVYLDIGRLSGASDWGLGHFFTTLRHLDMTLADISSWEGPKAMIVRCMRLSSSGGGIHGSQ